MTFDFTVKEFILGGGTGTPTFTFYRRGFNLGGSAQPSWKDVVISGIGSLTLVNAKANSLNYLKLFGGCEQDGTPTPTVPVDIVANNGVIKVKDDELPVGYKRLSYIESSGAQIIDTNYVLQETDSVEVDYNITNRSRSGDKFILGCQPILDNPNIGMWVETYGNQNSWYVRFGSPSSVNTTSTTSQLSGTLKISKGSFVVNGVEILQPAYNAMSPNQLSIFNRRSSNGSVPTAGCSAQVSSVRILNGNNIIRKYIPCESPDNILGLYEVTQGEFLTNNGDGDFTAGSYDTSHLTEIYYDGTVETVMTKQAFVNDNDIVDKTGLNSSNGSAITNANRCYVLFPCKAGVTYTAQTDSTYLIGGNFIEYSQPNATSANFIKSITATDDGLVGGVYKFHAVCDTDGWAGWQCKSDKATALANNWQITSDISTATAQPLLKVGDYKDVQNVTTGEITRNIGIYLLDGTEDWQAVGTSYADGSKRYYFNDNDYSRFADTGELCTHFVQSPLANRDLANQTGHFFSNQNSFHIRIPSSLASDVTALKSWLKGQFDAGTPVIFTYPLATPTTESVTGQPLTIQAGTNVVEITQASIDNLELEVSYKAGVEVTVEEIEAVNNDESVEVTING